MSILTRREFMQAAGGITMDGAIIRYAPFLAGGALGMPSAAFGSSENTYADMNTPLQSLIFPEPKEISSSHGDFILDDQVRMVVPTHASEEDVLLATTLANELADRFGIYIKTERVASLRKGQRVIVMGSRTNPLIQQCWSESAHRGSPEYPGAEGYILHSDPNIVVVAGADDQGAWYGMQSLRQILVNRENRTSIRGLHVRDWPDKPFRGIYLFLPGRDNIVFFKRFISEYMALYKFNTLIMEMGSSMRLESHPELNHGWVEFARDANYSARNYPPNPFHEVEQNSSHQDTADGGYLEKEEVADLAQWVRRHRIELVPEIASFTHSYYLLTEHRDLAAVPENKWPDISCPTNPKSYSLVFEVYDEYIELLKPKSIHIGHDELFLPVGASPSCEDRDIGELFGEDIKQIHGHLASKGVKTQLWGDMLLQSVRGVGLKNRKSPDGWKYQTPGGMTPEQVERLVPKDCLIFNWFWHKDGGTEEQVEINEATLDKMGFQQVFGNLTPDIENYESRKKRASLLGGAPSAWSATNEFNFGKDLMANFLGSAGILWTGKVMSGKELSGRIQTMLPGVRERLSGVTPPSITEATITSVDIAKEFNISETIQSLGTDLKGLKAGSIQFGKVPLALRPSGDKYAIAVGTGERKDTGLPREVNGIKVGEAVTSLIFLHASAKRASNKESFRLIWDQQDTADLLGWYEIVYEDGFITTIPIRYGVNVLELDWDKRSSAQDYCYGADAVSVGNDSARDITFFAFEWVNPRLGKVIEEINLKATKGFKGGSDKFDNSYGRVIDSNAVILSAISMVKKRVEKGEPGPASLSRHYGAAKAHLATRLEAAPDEGSRGLCPPLKSGVLSAAVKMLWLFFFVLFGLLGQDKSAAAAGMSQVRIRQNLNAGWFFARQAHGAGELGSFDRDTVDAARVEAKFKDAIAPAYDDSRWDSIDLPHTWNAYDVSDEQSGYWRGIGWYRKHFRVDSKYAGRRIKLEFEGANQTAEVWLNGKYLGSHKGGYTGFSFEIRPQFDTDNVLTVKVDNLFDATVPPTVKTDYSFYGGIYRSVSLVMTRTTFVSDMYWTTPNVSEATAQTDFHSRITNESGNTLQLTVLQELLDPDGSVVDEVATPITVQGGQTKALTQSSHPLKRPKLWSPGTPNLYHIRTSLRNGSELLDVCENPLGFRWFHFDPQQGFFLNGKRLQIQGTNMHQSYPGMGNAVPKSRLVKDIEVAKDMGANFWRTSHYPHDISMMDASDRLGLMVWEELPINKEIGNTDEYIGNVSNMAREMIGRDRNHPSVVLWGIAGEINAPVSVSSRVVGTVTDLYHHLDSTRPVVMHAPRGEAIEGLVDVVGEDTGRETDEKHVQHPMRPYMIGEYSVALTERGRYGSVPNSEDLSLDNHERHLAELNARPWMAGGCIWNEFDYDGETYDPVVPHMVSFGMTDIWRIPKESYYFYQSQWAEKPMVHIVGHWTWPGEEGKTRAVKVLSNQPEVELLLNGKSLGSKKNIAGTGLRFPPRVWQVPYEPGTLEARAKTPGKVLSDQRRTAGPAFKILLESDTSQVISGNPESLAYITASIVDENGEVVPGAHDAITFTGYGPGKLLEQSWLGHGTGLTWNAVDGRTRIAFRSTPRSGRAVISAYSPGLISGRLSIEVTGTGKGDEMNYVDLSPKDELQ